MEPERAYNLKLQAQGRVVVPSAVRAELGVREGDELILLQEAGGYRLTSRRVLARTLYGSLSKPSGASDHTAELLAEREAERQAKDW